MKPQISIVLSSFKPEEYLNIYSRLPGSIGNYTYELVCVGPNFPPYPLQQFGNIKYVRDFGCPSRCVQIGASISEGKFFTWTCDGALFDTLGYSQCADILSDKTRKDIVNVRYDEGPNYQYNPMHLRTEYWKSHTHPVLVTKQSPENLDLAIFGFYNLDYFIEMGGVDCKFEHINMNSHDLAFRIQRDGGKVYQSPTRVMALNWEPHNLSNPVHQAYTENDEPLWKKMYNSDEPRPLKIDFNNWKSAETFWSRRFGVRKLKSE